MNCLKLFFFTCLLVLSQTLFSQIDADPALYIEAGGMGTGYSVNYVKPILENDGFTGYFRIGASALRTRVAVPIGFVLVSKARTHHWELTAGLTPISEGYRFWLRNSSDIGINYILGTGYRYQTRKNNYYVSLGLFHTFVTDPTTASFSETPVRYTIRAAAGLGILIL